MVRISARYLAVVLLIAVRQELLDTVFRTYTAVKSWDVVRSAVYGNEFRHVFVLQYGIGNLVPLVLLLIPRLTIRRAVAGAALVLFGVFMMRWNVVIGGQSFSLTLAGYIRCASVAHSPTLAGDAEGGIRRSRGRDHVPARHLLRPLEGLSGAHAAGAGERTEGGLDHGWGRGQRKQDGASLRQRCALQNSQSQGCACAQPSSGNVRSRPRIEQP